MIPVVIRVYQRAPVVEEAAPVYTGQMPGVPNAGDFVVVGGVRLFVIAIEWKAGPSGSWHAEIMTEDLARPQTPSALFAPPTAGKEKGR